MRWGETDRGLGGNCAFIHSAFIRVSSTDSTSWGKRSLGSRDLSVWLLNEGAALALALALARPWEECARSRTSKAANASRKTSLRLMFMFILAGALRPCPFATSVEPRNLEWLGDPTPALNLPRSSTTPRWASGRLAMRCSFVKVNDRLQRRWH